MVKVTYIEHDGTVHSAEAQAGWSVMETATKQGIPGIDAECGGACACGTCQVYVDDAWQAIVGPAAANEAAMLDFVDHVQPNSRLSCQIKISAALDGLVVRLPPSQH